ncbi:hypothetical protein PN465_01460 [Nodularia spumigena CS-584]|nr:hypothetical protein [Nodularia spumigena CS-584]
MAVLRKIRSATLVEALTATVIIIVIFVVASLVINNMLLNLYNSKTRDIDSRLNELHYAIVQNKERLPYNGEAGEWKIVAVAQTVEGCQWVLLSAISSHTGKKIEQTFVYEKQ